MDFELGRLAHQFGLRSARFSARKFFQIARNTSRRRATPLVLMASHIDSELVKKNQRWLQGLAVELLGDTHRAQEVVQDAWVAAVQRPPRCLASNEGLRSWLRQVVRNLAFSVLRRDRRWQRGRANLTPASDVPSAAEVAEQGALRVELVKAVDDLQPVYREVLVMRYFEGMSTTEIADRLGQPGGTVRSRLSRGLDLLRVRLDKAYQEDRGAWLAALVPLAGRSLAEATNGLLAAVFKAPTTIMNTQFKLLASLSVLAVLGAGAWWMLPDGTAEAAAEPHGLLGSNPDLAEVEPTLGDEPARVVALGERRAIDAGPKPLVGRVRTVFGAPVADAKIDFRPTGTAAGQHLDASSDAEGAFSVLLSGGPGELLARHEDYVMLLAWGVGESASAEEFGESPEIVVAPRHHYGGTVVDEDGNPVGGADVEIVIPEGWLGAVRTERSSLLPSWRTKSGEDGSFEITDVAWSNAMTLQASKPGFQTRGRRLMRSNDGVVLRLIEFPAGVEVVSGSVILSDRSPVVGARVFYGDRVVSTDRDGEFALEFVPGLTEVLVVKRDFLPVRREFDAGPDELAPIVLAEAALTIEGSVVDEAGDPVSFANVWIQDTTGLPAEVEADAGGIPCLEDLIGLSGDTDGSSHQQPLGADGLFRLYGLLPRAYTVLAVHPRTLEVQRFERVQAGRRDLRIVMSGRGTHRVAGRVVSTSGLPLSNVSVTPRRSGTVNGERFRGPFLVRGRLATDVQGRFDFGSMFVEGTRLLFSSESASAASLDLTSGMDLADLEIRLQAQVELQIILERDPEAADRVQVLDAEGQRLRISTSNGQGSTTGGSAPLVGGETPVLTVPDSAFWVVLHKDGREVRRVPLQLGSGRQVLRL